jgi:hypothetical protein
LGIQIVVAPERAKAETVEGMSVGTCKLCKQVKEFARAHIIPRSFCLLAKGGSKQLRETRQHVVKDVKDWQNGVWDDQILCEACERGFSSWDSYGFDVLGNPLGNDALPQNESETQAFVMKDIVYSRLKLFVLSVLWRASVSDQPFFSRIQLGKHGSIIADMIRSRNPGGYDEFPMVLGRLVRQRVPNAMFAPYRQRTPEGINFNVLFLPSIKIMVKVDQRPLPQILEPVVLRQQPENVVVPMTLHRNEVLTLCECAEIFRRWQRSRERFSGPCPG